jgi:hypothetical protein
MNSYQAPKETYNNWDLDDEQETTKIPVGV